MGEPPGPAGRRSPVRPLKVVLHDFAGHPFQAELSRRLAARGHDVTHLTSAEWVSGKGRLQTLPGDPARLRFGQLSVGRPIAKYSAGQRMRWELDYGAVSARQLDDDPDVVIICNVPLLSMGRFVWHARRRRVPWVLWHQDIWSAAMGDEARRRWPRPVAAVVARAFDWLEAWSARHAAQVVAIGDEFTKVYPRWRIDPDKVSVIPNWAPLNDIVPAQRENPQADVVFGPDRRPESLRLLYAGSLGRKHNPLLLVELLRAVRAAGVDAVLTVVSEGEAADDVRAAAVADPELPLRVVEFQPAAQLAETMGTADVLLGLLEPEATNFSIPSKVLTYMSSGRPIVGLMPDANPAAIDIVDCGGFIADPTSQGAAAAAEWIAKIADDPEARARIGRTTRAVAEQRFDPERITDRFEAVLQRTQG